MASVTTSGMNVATSNVSVQRRAQGLLDPNAQQAEAGDVRMGTGVDPTKVSPSPLAADTSGLNAGLATDATAVSDMITVKPVDFKTIEGSYPGDHRAKGAPAVMPEQPNVREPMRQAQSSKHLPQQPAPFLSDTEGSEGDRA